MVPKETINKTKSQHRLGKNIYKWCDLQGVNVQNMQTTHTIQCQKNRQANKKMHRSPKCTFLQRRHIDGQKTHKKMLNATKH